MGIRIILIVSVLGIVAASCSANLSSEPKYADELGWCAQVDNSEVVDAIFDAAHTLDVDFIGGYLLDKAGITTDVDPTELSAEDLTEEELAALVAVGDSYEDPDALWIEYINSPDGAKACFLAYAEVNG
jgi:hypothetical protein